jgi:hypothetical protein
MPEEPIGGPWGMARRLEVVIAEVTEKQAACSDPGEARRLKQTLKMQRSLLRWCKTRAGYRPPT